MMTRDHNNIVFECDGCGEVLETETSSFESAQNILHRQHWKARKALGKLSDEWLHFCPDCE
jgi:Fe2+ or Zn2+ uptake regulation protein